uniref:Uncharacterized protein n=1 Tax=Arundo donax TaxID=35708 RepID=A0A0A9DKL2_ARUDO
MVLRSFCVGHALGPSKCHIYILLMPCMLDHLCLLTAYPILPFCLVVPAYLACKWVVEEFREMEEH